jgi:hypothetical protein
MTYLVFQPALDPLHTIFRFLRIRPLLIETRPVTRDHVRVVDFFLLFPFLIRGIRLTQTHQRFKKLSEKYVTSKPYGEQPDSTLLFKYMEPIQEAALETVATRRFIDPMKLKSDLVEPTDLELPKELAQRIKSLNDQQADLMEFLSVLLADYEILGDQGLKARTGLSEFRYDAI